MMLSAPLIVLLAVGAPAPEAEGAAKAAAIAPFLGDEVAAVAHFDLARVNIPSFVRSVVGTLADEEDVSQASKAAGGWVDALRQAGAKNLYLLLDPADVPGLPVLVVPLSDGTDAGAVAKVLSDGQRRMGSERGPASETIRGAVVAGSPAALARIREAKPKDRPEVASALAAGGDAAIRIVIVPSTTQRRAIEESMPNLPPELGGAPITTLSRGLRWATFAIAAEPKPALHAVVQSKDADAAKSLRTLAQDAFKLLGRNASADPGMADVIKTLSQTPSQIQGDQIVLDADLEKTAALVAVPIRKAREAARRSQCVNNLKQIGLAMHNYHSTYNAFPPAYTADKNGKPLLSWRVLILPFLEQEPLYKQFKLDESWDSPHNKALISRMPPMLACPSGSRKLAGDGKTTYLTPRGAATIFPGPTGIKIQAITDGTSNTILVLEANDDSAVTWTRPDDWEVPTPFTTKGLFPGHHPNGTNVEFADGSVRFLKDLIAPNILQKLLTRDGGEVISADEF